MLISNYFKLNNQIAGRLVVLDPKLKPIYYDLKEIIANFPYHSVYSSILLEYWNRPSKQISEIFGFNENTINNIKSSMNKEIESYVRRTYVKDLKKLNHQVLLELQHSNQVSTEIQDKITKLKTEIKVTQGIIEYSPNQLGLWNYYNILYPEPRGNVAKYELEDVQAELKEVVSISQPMVLKKLRTMDTKKLKYVLKLMLQVPENEQENLKRIKMYKYAQSEWNTKG